MIEPRLGGGVLEVRERLERHRSRTEHLDIKIDLRHERAVLVQVFSELVVKDLNDIEHYYNLLHYPVQDREIISSYIWLARSYATMVDDESAMRLLFLEERATALLEFLKRKYNDRLEEDILQLLM